MSTIIDSLYKDNEDLVEYLKSMNQVSFQTNVEDSFRKTFLLAIASYFESKIRDILVDFFEEQGCSGLIFNFIKNKAMERQYHTYFSWKESNANSFFALFGSEFGTFMKTEVKRSKELEESIRAFLKLGNLRNALVHDNFATYSLNSTTNEIYADYKKAILFVELLPEKFREYARNSLQGSQLD